MRKRRRILFFIIVLAFSLTPLAFFYSAILDEARKNHSDETVNSFQSNQKLNEIARKYNETGCDIFPGDIDKTHSSCLKKMKWMKTGWQTHRCYAQNYVDGSTCSFRYYLSNIELHCPPIHENKESGINRQKNMATMDYDISQFTKILEDVPSYMKTRITRLWESWRDGALKTVRKYPTTMEKRKKLNILVFIGFLANESKLKLAKKSGHGGPLGELLQWSDLLASLSIIGHNVLLSSDKSSLRITIQNQKLKGPCEYVDGTRQQLDLIFTDIMGLNILRKFHRQFITENSCRIRLVDSFGTHAEFRTKSYFLKHMHELSGPFSSRNPWGGHGLDLRQHWTFFPHTHDNTFLGFVVDTSAMKSTHEDDKKWENNKKLKALVYGKEQYMWKQAETPIRILKELAEVHATVADIESSYSDPNMTKLFDGVINHGFLSPDQISNLLDDVHIFFGFGFPLEGPAPLEAIAHGAVFINAKFKVPKSRKNYQFLAEKPTLREWTSQSPYMEMIGEPHVLTVDIENEGDLREAIQKVKLMKPFRKIPVEFTTEGMILRVAQLVEKQDFCIEVADGAKWPPIEALQIIKSNTDESCESACWRSNFSCEPSFFPNVNKNEKLTSYFPECAEIGIRLDSVPTAPFNCTIQASPELFSCASKPSSNYTSRLCPCRDFMNEQHAVCKDCL